METALSQTVFPALRSLLRRIRLYIAVAAAARLCAAAALCFVVQFGLDYCFRMRVDLRASLLLAILAVLSYLLWKGLIRPLTTRAELVDAAALIEDRFPQLQSRLISAVQFAAGQFGGAESNSPVLIDRMLAQTAEAATGLSWKLVLNHRRARVHVGVVGAIGVALLVLMLWAGEALGVWFERSILLREVSYRQNTSLTVINDEDGDGIVHWPRGDDLVVRVRVDGRHPGFVALDLRFDSDKYEEHPMTAVGEDEFRFTVPRLSEPLELWAGGGDGRTPVVRVELVERPRIEEAAVTVHPPAYTHESPYQLRAGTPVIEVLSGSEVEIFVTANKPLKRAVLLRDQEQVGGAQPAAEGCLARFRPDRNATYSFDLTDLTDLTSIRPRQFLVRLLADAPPTVTLGVKGASDLVTPQAVLPLTLSFKDRYGLAAAELVCAVDEAAEETRMPIDQLNPGALQLTVDRELVLSDLGVDVDTRLVLTAEALDLNDVTGPGRGQAARYAFRVVNTEELLAELARREQEYRQEFERVIEMQERLRNDLLSAATGFQRGAAGQSRNINIASSERRQGQLGQQASHVRSQFQRLFDELSVNQLVEAQAEERLLGGIVAPLTTLAGRTIPQTAEHLARLAADPSTELFVSIDREQETLLLEMRRVLANMSKWEGFHETVGLLQTIIKMQKELRDETDAALNQQVDEIFKKK